MKVSVERGEPLKPAATERSPVIDPERLARACWLDCQRVAPDRYLISGGRDDHVVVVQDGRAWCDCVDSQWKGDGCKHSLIVRLCEGDVEVVKALRQLVPAPARSVMAA